MTLYGDVPREPCRHCGRCHRWPRCADCHVALMPNTPPGRQDWERYMVRDEVWAAGGMTPNGGWLCTGCLQVRLGRTLDSRDLIPGLRINQPGRDDDTPRLAALKLAAELDQFIHGCHGASGECSCPTCRHVKAP